MEDKCKQWLPAVFRGSSTLKEGLLSGGLVRLPRLHTEAGLILRKRALLGELGVRSAEQSACLYRRSEVTPYRDLSSQVLSTQPDSEEQQGRGHIRKGKARKRRTASQTSSEESLDLSSTQKQLVKRPKLKVELYPQVYSYLSGKLSRAVRKSNGMRVGGKEQGYKFYVGAGNNDQLVALLMKRRWYWTRVEMWIQADFIWTQNRTIEIVQSLPSSSQSLSPLPQSLLPPKHIPRTILSQAKMTDSGLSLLSSSCYQAYQDLPAYPPLRIYNRLEKTHQITSKKWLYLNMRRYYEHQGEDPFSHLPLTYLIEEGAAEEMQQFEQRYSLQEGRNLWIVKPGENTNCGYGIQVSGDLATIKTLVKGASRYRHRTFLIQKYIENPLLINRRKFDIRCYGLVTSFHSHVQGYFYHDGYLRTSSREFSLSNVDDRFIHLTNDAVQKTAEDYGRFENANKLSYAEFERFLKNHHPKVDFWKDIWPQIRQITIDTFRATWGKLDPKRRCYTFEILGYDFMIDSNFHVWLIEVNTNPCLSLCSAHLSKLIPAMLDNAYRLVLDPYFPEPFSKKHSQEWASQSFQNRFELVFSSLHTLSLAQDLALSDSASEAGDQPA